MIRNKIKEQEEEIRLLLQEKKRIEDRIVSILKENTYLKLQISIEENIIREKNERIPDIWIDSFNDPIPQIQRNIYQNTYEWYGTRHPLWRMVYKIKPYSGPLTSFYKDMLELDRQDFIDWCNRCKNRYIAREIKEGRDTELIVSLKSFKFN